MKLSAFAKAVGAGNESERMHSYLIHFTGTAHDVDTGSILHIVVLFADPFAADLNQLPPSQMGRGGRACEVSKFALLSNFLGPHLLGPCYLLQSPFDSTQSILQAGTAMRVSPWAAATLGPPVSAASGGPSQRSGTHLTPHRSLYQLLTDG